MKKKNTDYTKNKKQKQCHFQQQKPFFFFISSFWVGTGSLRTGLRSGVVIRPLVLPPLALCFAGFSMGGFLTGLITLGRGSIFSVAMLLSSSTKYMR